MVTTRDKQRSQTHDRIINAAVESFALNGFDGASTRDIAARAEVTQGLVSYHFESKELLWRAAADHIFAGLAGVMPGEWAAGGSEVDIDGARQAIRAYVRFAAERPELFHFAVDAGRSDGEAMRWLAERHFQPWFERIALLVGHRDSAVHFYYALAGAASLIFAVGPECRTLTGTDPSDSDVIERHADFVASLFLP